jgi:hypothetical protein
LISLTLPRELNVACLEKVCREEKAGLLFLSLTRPISGNHHSSMQQKVDTKIARDYKAEAHSDLDS